MIPVESIIPIISAAVICAVITRMCNYSANTKKLIRLITALFMLLMFISNFTNIEAFDFTRTLSIVQYDAEAFAQDGAYRTRERISDIIKEEVETYILSRAQQYGLELEVKVADINIETMKPTKIYLKGVASPYSKKSLEAEIQQDLGIPKENQIWS